MDLVSRGVIARTAPNVHLLSASSYIGITSSKYVFVYAVLNILGYAIFPISLGLFLPTFMFAIVYEKEMKITNMMKIHGLKAGVYWASNIAFYLMIFSFSVFAFLWVGKWVLEVPMLAQTNLGVLVSVG